MVQRQVIPVIMCGGAGSRLWPVSRSDQPKQFHAIVGEKTLLESTLARVTGCLAQLSFEPYVLMSSVRHRATIDRLRPQNIACGGVIYEPCPRSTAPAVAVATRFVSQINPDAAALLLSSDAYIANTGAFHEAIAAGVEAVNDGSLVTFGIMPDRPETGYGYIRRGVASGPAFEVEAFVEKPDLATAKTYLQDGSYYWNAGIFLFQPAEMATEFRRQAPEMWHHAGQAFEQAERQDDILFLASDPFAACNTESIDYAIMENAERIKVVPVNMGWDDIGSWSQVYDVADHDEKRQYGAR